jgi:hypothetical protein
VVYEVLAAPTELPYFGHAISLDNPGGGGELLADPSGMVGMARRRKNSGHWIEAVVPLVGLPILALVVLSGAPGAIAAFFSAPLPVLMLGALLALAALIVYWVFKYTNTSAWEFGSQRTLRTTQPLRSVDMTTLESMDQNTAADTEADPGADTDDKPYAPEVWVSPSPIIIRPESPFTAADPMSPEVTGQAGRARPWSGQTAGWEARHTPDQEAGGAKRTPTPSGCNAADLVDRLHSIDWFQFEKIVARIYEKQGFAVTRRGGANPDGGIDMIIEANGVRKGVQCKQWKQWKIRERTVRELVGALRIEGLDQGVFVTLGGGSNPARELAARQGIEIVEADQLARWLEEVDARYDPEMLDLLNGRSKLCPKCESEMVLRTNRTDPNSQFWGCSTYPRCHFTMPLAE